MILEDTRGGVKPMSKEDFIRKSKNIFAKILKSVTFAPLVYTQVDADARIASIA